MSQKYEQSRNNAARFLSMTSLTHEDFVAFLPYFEASHNEYLSKYELSGKRKKGGRRFVIYSSSPLNSVAERLFFILYALKHNPVQEALAAMFDMDTKPCHEYLHGFHHILSLSIERTQMMPARTDKALLEKLKSLKDKELLHDGTEREIPRPTNAEKQKENYSGKKKKHTIKNAIVSTMLGMILFVSPTYAGKVHDKRMADDYHIPSGCVLWQDTGYQGYRPDGVTIIQPDKKPRGGELTAEQKHLNSSISRFRVRVEHSIGGIKRLRILKDECRAYKNDFRDKIIATSAGLHNFRTHRNPIQYPDNQ